MALQAGDLIVDHEAPPESQSGLMLVVRPDLIFESLECFTTPCQVSRRLTNGLQCQFAEDRLAALPPRSRRFELYRLSPLEKMTDGEAAELETLVRWILLHADIPLALRRFSSVVAVGQLLMRLGKMPRVKIETYSVSMLISTLVEIGVYVHIGQPALVEAVLSAA